MEKDYYKRQEIKGRRVPKRGICSQCKKGPREIPYLHLETKQNICRTCYLKLPDKSKLQPKIGICPECGKGPRKIPYHPKGKRNICKTCYQRLTGKSLPKKGICSQCGKGPRRIHYLHPETREHICRTCYKKLTGKSLPLIGICFQCKKGPREIPYRHPDGKGNICSICYRGLKNEKSKAKTAIESEREFLQWFRNLTDDEAARWIIERANQKDPELNKSLKFLLSSEKSKMKWVLNIISHKPTANGILLDYLKTVEVKGGKDGKR